MATRVGARLKKVSEESAADNQDLMEIFRNKEKKRKENRINQGERERQKEKKEGAKGKKKFGHRSLVFFLFFYLSFFLSLFLFKLFIFLLQYDSNKVICE